MDIKIFKREIGNDHWEEVKDLYWFEEQGIHDFSEEEAERAGYEIKIEPGFVEYEEIVKILENATLTYIPALFIGITKLSYRRKIWASVGKASEIVKKIEEELK